MILLAAHWGRIDCLTFGYIALSIDLFYLLGLPNRFLKIMAENADDNFYQRIALYEHEDLNLPESPCNDDPSYSFRACVSKKIARDIGCRTRWNLFADKSLPVCSNISQFRYLLWLS